MGLATSMFLIFSFLLQMKSLITHAMQDPEGNLRLLLATEAYGMGADPPDVHDVIHVGPPSSLESVYCTLLIGFHLCSVI